MPVSGLGRSPGRRSRVLAPTSPSFAFRSVATSNTVHARVVFTQSWSNSRNKIYLTASFFLLSSLGQAGPAPVPLSSFPSFGASNLLRIAGYEHSAFLLSLLTYNPYIRGCGDAVYDSRLLAGPSNSNGKCLSSITKSRL